MHFKKLLITLKINHDDVYYVLNKDTTGLPTEDSKNVFVSISLANGAEKVSIQERDVAGKKEFYISGEDLSKLNDNDEADLLYHSQGLPWQGRL